MAVRSPLITVMANAAIKAARGLQRDFGEVEQLQVSQKGPADFVSTADHRAEAVLIAELQKARPKYGFLLEESGEIAGADTSNRWVIDPLDGTTNFLHGVPHFAISIGLERDGQLHAGVIYDPLLDEMFWAEAGAGAFMNNRRLRVSSRRTLADSLIAELEAISDNWLKRKNTREKGFSLGFFERDYVRQFSTALVRQEGRIIAFANVLHSSENEELSIDLMRFVEEAPSGTMDYLFAQLMLRGQADGFRWFNLGMAPLAGMEAHPLAPTWNRVAEIVFRHGEHFYNFQGLRDYKDKLDRKSVV